MLKFCIFLCIFIIMTRLSYAQVTINPVITTTITIPQTTATLFPPIIGGDILSLKIGLLIPRNSSFSMYYDNSASAVTLALSRLYNDRIFSRYYNVTFEIVFEECSLDTASGYTYYLIKNRSVDAIFAPPCIETAIVSSHVATYYNIPVILWGITFASTFADTTLFPTVISVVPNFGDLSNAICEMFKKFDWKQFSFVYQTVDDGACSTFQQDFEAVTNSRNDCLISFKDIVDSWAAEDIDYTVQQIKLRSRIVVLCFDNLDQQRDFALRLFDAGLTTPDYVYILPDTDMSITSIETIPFWIDQDAKPDGRDPDAEVIGRLGFQLHIDSTVETSDSVKNFNRDVIEAMDEWPFYCTTCNKNINASRYAQFLYDGMYIYGMALSRTINESGISEYRNGTKISDNSNNDIPVQGMSGKIVMGTDGLRDTIFAMSGYSSTNSLQPYITLAINGKNVNITELYTDPATTIWASRGGVQPRDTPRCGFDGNGCPLPPFEQYKGLIIAGICASVVVLMIIIGGISYVIHIRVRENKRQNKLWQVPFNNLVKVSNRQHRAEQSQRSIQSGPSTTSTRFTFDSVKSSKNFTLYTLHQDKIIAYKHPSRVLIDQTDMAEFRQMRQLDHDNLNRFIGMSIDGPEILSVWRCCSRGSLKDVITSNTMNMDAFFIFSLIKDVCEGLVYIHNSYLGCHGNIKSSYCLIDDRWQVKISNYGLKKFRNLEARKAKELLWTAPEIIRENNYSGSKAGDIYSFAIVCSEVINMKTAFEATDNGSNPEGARVFEKICIFLEIVYLVKKGGPRPLRPTLQPVIPDINTALLHLVRDCWSESPNERPKAETIRSLLKSMVSGRSANLMDHVFNMLEQYAGSLEEEVEERTKELVEEKKKSDILLYRMLPKQVADKLKLGHSVEPETFESVTVFFSDVVSFTTLASRCTPLQVVNLLNDLYTIFDGIIGEYDVYKVETIGDGYLCVSGLPHRNGNEHARHIANMSLGFIKSLDRFSIPHLPGERIMLRIGLHTGGCVAGVVGLAMPRYCLFGDTVNTASRMESNGKPNRIHISADTNRYLTHIIGGYVTESRGEVIIKGKGVMETFWLLGQLEGAQKTPPRESVQTAPEPQPMYEVFKRSTR